MVIAHLPEFNISCFATGKCSLGSLNNLEVRK